MKNKLMLLLAGMTLNYSSHAQVDTVQKKVVIHSIESSLTSTKQYYDAYILCNPISQDYQRLMKTQWDEFDQERFDHQISPTQYKTLKSFNIQGVLGEWRPLYQYKKALYVFDDGGTSYRDKHILTQKLFIQWSMEGPHPTIIKSVSIKNDRDYIIRLKDGGTLKVQIIDPKRQVAVFTEMRFGEKIQSLLVKNRSSTSIPSHCSRVS